MAKGSAFERLICKAFSKWWTYGERDDVFWRTAGSGARATTRRKTKKGTFGQDGDMQATDPIGQPLMDLCTIEDKHGYKGACLFDIFDKPNNLHPLYEKFIEQSEREAEEAGVPYWMLVACRHRKTTIICMPYALFRQFPKRAKSGCYAYFKLNSHGLKSKRSIAVIPLEDFTKLVLPKTFLTIHKKQFKNGQRKKKRIV